MKSVSGSAARDDRVISTRGLNLLRKWLTEDQSEVVLLPHGSHAIARGKAKEEVLDRAYEFSQKVDFSAPATNPRTPWQTRDRQSHFNIFYHEQNIILSWLSNFHSFTSSDK